MVAELTVDTHSFFLTFAGDEMLIAYTVSDGTHLIFGGALKPATSHMYMTVIDKSFDIELAYK